MELRRLCVCIGFLMLATISQSTEAKSALRRRSAEEEEDSFLGDAAGDDEAQNDADGGDDDDDDAILNATILTHPKAFNVTVGRSVRLECKVNPENGTVVQWSKDGEIYFLGKEKTKPLTRLSIDSGSKDLIIKDVKHSDSGKYTCKVMQQTPAFIEHTLSVVEAPRIRGFFSSQYVVMEGSELKLTCEVAGSPPLQIILSKEGPVGNELLNKKSGEFTMNSLTVKSVKKQHAGNYFCYAMNSVGNTQANLTVKVLGKPSIHIPRTIVNSAVGVEAILQCSVHDEAGVEINWYKDGELVSEEMVQVSTGGAHSNLTVIPKDERYFGTYTCEAANEYGKHNRSIDLVQSPVVENLRVDGAKLSWTVHSHQPLEEIVVNLRDVKDGLDWKKIDVPLPKSKQHKYNLEYEINSQEINPGRYEAFVGVRNDNSWSSQKDSVMVDIDVRSEYSIATASVLGSTGTGKAHSIGSPSAVVLSTFLMYLLVRTI